MKNSFSIGLLIISLLIGYPATAQNSTGDEDSAMFNKAKERDEAAINDAIDGWWTTSMKTHEQRVAWWREARFGMFVHWGIYSLPAGEWKGKKVEGYAEHIMRKEKITRAEYLEIAHKFDPVNFNADQWIAEAKKAGMRYFIITAKHHDGFAMYPSKVSDFNIYKQTPFKRDPMAELASACKKYGLKFGFYYSHAFDWEDPDAPGNDWEYKNPGGDLNLYGGRNWYEVHPELLPKAIRYVNEKAIPQIKELIRKYHPDILWFDTPQKLPLSENIRILKAIRKIDPNVVVNGRLARSASVTFGDYKNTSDRPAEFLPVNGDWEAIPTTNESYGYHQFDNSHKPAAFFIRLLAKAASGGGNLLMNVGPMGNGSFDSKDVKILDSIGLWMNKNGESIYGTNRTPLPLQSWGVSTLKNNQLYLHVFNWPANGRLVVGGLKSEILNAYILDDNSKGKLQVKRIDSLDIEINIPLKAPDPVNSIIVLELKGKPVTDPVRLVSDTQSARLLAFDADLHGKGFRFGDGKAKRYYVENWNKLEQWVSWNFRTIEPARFDVVLKFTGSASSGGAFSVICDDQELKGIITKQQKSGEVNSLVIGSIQIPHGLHKLQIKALKISKDELMKLLEIQLIPAQSLKKIFSDAKEQTLVMISEIRNKTIQWKSDPKNLKKPEVVSPRTIDTEQNLVLVPARDWTSGFFPGELWFLYEYTGKEEWKELAGEFTARIENEKWNGKTHDMGFKIYCSFGNGYRITHDTAYRSVIVQSAKTLATRFNPRVGCIRSWDHSRDKWDFPVIIDNMMNLELLFAATRLTGDSMFYRIAVSHANTTMKNHFRPDYSSFHVVDYDSVTGRVIKRTTHQGYSDASAWSRGQAWGLYGYTMCYRETGDPKYLNQAEHIAEFILDNPNLPEDMIPYWDFDAPGIPDEPRDASAAAVIASGLYELCKYSKNARLYSETADRIMKNLTTFYRSPIGENKGFILLHSTGSKPANSEVDVPLCYADYYYLEALLRLKELHDKNLLYGHTIRDTTFRVFALDMNVLNAEKIGIQRGEKKVMTAYQILLKEADKSITRGPYSVINKTQLPPSGDKHDYMSLAPYFWPNPETSGGLPYIRRDGERNPDINKVNDKSELLNMERDVEVLSLAYYFSGNEKYASRAAYLVRTWFLLPATKMNPNVKYGQAVMGRNDGRGEGVLETRGILKVMDAIGLIRGSASWTTNDQMKMESWVSEFLDWMQNSPIGKSEMRATNNHGVWYDAQRLSYALFLGRVALADSICKNALNRLDKEMADDGSFPRELARTKSFGYSLFIMQAFFQIAVLAENTDVDLWNAVTPSGKSLKKGLEFLLPYVTKEKQWNWKQIQPFNYESAVTLIKFAARKMNRPELFSTISKTYPASSVSGWQSLQSGFME